MLLNVHRVGSKSVRRGVITFSLSSKVIYVYRLHTVFVKGYTKS